MQIMASQPSFRQALTWAYAMNWGERGFTVAFTFLLASLLGPREFGTIAIAMVYILFIQMFLEQGFVAALIQRRNLRPEHIDSVFWTVLAASLLLAGLSVACSGLWAGLNNLPDLSLVITLLSFSIPIAGLTVVQRALLQRQMDFKSLSLPANISVLVGGAVGVGMALNNLGVWALVGQHLTKSLVALLLLWRVSVWRPRLRFSLQGLKELLGFSTASFVARLGVFANQQADALVMGMFFGPVAVGLYRLADRLMRTLLEIATLSLQVVSLSEFSRLQNQPEELQRSVLRCLRISSIVTVPGMAALAVTSDALIGLLGAKWAGAADVLKIVCILGIALAFTNFTGPLLQARSRPRYLVILVWLEAMVGTGILLLAAAFWRGAPVEEQVVGIASARVVTGAVLFAPMFVWMLLRISGISTRDFIATIAPSMASAASITAVALTLKAGGFASEMRGILALFAYGAVTCTVGAGTLILLDRQLRMWSQLSLVSVWRSWRGLEATQLSSNTNRKA